MTTLNIGTNDMTAIKEIQQMVVQKFHFDVQIIQTKPSKKTKTKWGNFADRMSGLTTPEITKHIENTSKEMRDSFSFRDLTSAN